MADHSQDTCPICLCEVEHLAILPCNHRFCYVCITKWAKSKLHCPLCKTEFSSIQHSNDPSHVTFTTEILPPPAVALVDTTHPDFECLTDTYFIQEITRLVANAEKGKRELRSNPKQWNDYGLKRLNQVINRLNEIKLMLQSDITFSPYEVLTELYQVESVLQLLWSGRIDELAVSFPDPTAQTTPVRRYGADDYKDIEEENEYDNEYDQDDDIGRSSSRRRQVPRKQDRFHDYDDYDYY